MNYVKKAIWGPTPEEQKNKCNSLLRKNQREIDRQLSNLNTIESKSVSMIKSAMKRNDTKSARLLAKEVYGLKKQRERLHKSKAQLSSVGMQVNESFAMRKIEGSMKISTGVMHQVNSLIHLPQLTGTMQSLSQELMKAGIIDEMVSDTLDNIGETDYLAEDEYLESEVDKILADLLDNKFDKVNQVPVEKVSAPYHEPEQEEDEEEDIEMLNSMKERLRALQS
ncbi:hypothetical protein NADFUDRAFT_47236 [Nadsonia fulvescens var. elongata DSM 6958]|uniref:Snf7-domain-containing protein n=1 Tax=Nadsonia fulvescens var. elongata DSM 6958 TaxID=857566 RepID=A0A1E3PGS1_9ASCO|nr:hypothetical protein NADFUDRAFT_47236 [Nadsonia fulvescens var. elongata DSM 6958]